MSIAANTEWTVHTDPASGKRYSHNPATGKTIWGDASEHWVPRVGGALLNKLTGECLSFGTVEAFWNGEWYKCTIRNWKEGDTADVTWDDGTGTNDVEPIYIRNNLLKEKARKGAAWETHICWSSYKPFYVHRRSGESTWSQPEHREVWMRHLTSWRSFKEESYYNLTTGEVVDSPPAGWYCLVNEPAESFWYGEWHPCTVWRRRADGTSDVRWEDGTGTKGVCEEDIRLRATCAKAAPVSGTPPVDPDAHFRALGVVRALRGSHRRGPRLPTPLALESPESCTRVGALRTVYDAMTSPVSPVTPALWQPRAAFAAARSPPSAMTGAEA